MSPKQFSAIGLAAAACSAVAVAVFVAANPWSVNVNEHSPLLPAVRADAAKIEGIEIGSGKEQLKLALKDGRWIVDSANGYPANAQAVRQLVLSATEADLVERKTAKKDLHKMLGLADGEGGGTARTIRFKGADGAVIGEILAGNARSDVPGTNTGGTYVRRPGEDQTWLANRPLDGTASLRDWVQTKLIDLPTERIETMSLEMTGEAPLAIKRTDDKKSHALAEMPAGKRLKHVNSIDDIVEAASLIEFKSVRQAGSGTLPRKAGQAVLRIEKGLAATVDYFSDGKEAWVTITPSGEGEAKKQAEDLALRTKGWEFEVPLAEINATLKKRSELLEDASS